MIDKEDPPRDSVHQSTFSLVDLLTITTLAALAAFLFREGSRTESTLYGFGGMMGSLLMAGLILLVGIRFSRKSGALPRIIWVVIALVVTLLPLLMPFAY